MVEGVLPDRPPMLAACPYAESLLSGFDQRGRFPAGSPLTVSISDLAGIYLLGGGMGRLRRSRGPGTSLEASLFFVQSFSSLMDARRSSAAISTVTSRLYRPAI